MSESLRKAWYRLDLAALPRGIIAVESTADAAALWFGPVASILEELAEKLPAESHPEVAFLGDRRTHPLVAILKALSNSPGSAVDVTAQLGRYPVIGPLLWELSRGPDRPLAVLANSPLLDVEDWAVPDVTGRTLVFRLTGAGPVAPGFREVGPETDLNVLVEHFRDPIASVRIGYPAALGVDWDNDAFRWDDGQLIGEPPAALTLEAAFVHPEGQPPEAVVTRSGGGEHRIALVPVPPLTPPPVLRLTPAEGNVLNLWRRGTPFWCAACSRTHPPGQFRCATSGDGGLFPSLHNVALAYHATLRSGEWQLAPVSRGILQLPDGRALVNRAGAAPEYQYDGGRWDAYAGEPASFIPTDASTFLIRSQLPAAS